jgi:hypothetical protein
MVALALVAGVAAFELWIQPSNPPGFLPDEASMSYNAYQLAHHLRDENGALLPLYIVSFGDYKSPLFTYTLAAVLRVTGPHSEAARGLAAVGILAAVLLLGLLAWRRTASAAVGVAVVVLAGLTPWLFEVGRAAYEVALEPLLICLLLLAVEASWRKDAWTVRRGIGTGLALAGIAYVYAAGRLLAPLFAAALLVFASPARLRWLLAAYGTFALTAVAPIATYWFRHPGALTERYDQTSFITSSMSVWTIASRAASNYVHDMNLWHWIVSGDPKPYVHTYGSGSIFATVVLLALGSAALAVSRRRADRFWLFTVVLLLLSPIPAALTKDRFYGLRLVPLPVLLVVVALPALALLVGAARRGWVARLTAAGLVAVVALQFVHFVDNFRARGFARGLVFHAGVPGLLQRGFAGGARIFVNHDEPHALVYAKWYGVEHGISLARVVHVPAGTIPPDGSIVFGRFQPCAYICAKFVKADDYWLARARGPLGGEQRATPGKAATTVGVAPRSGLHVSFRGESHTVTAGNAWAYLLQVSRNGRPWRGTVVVTVETRSGEVVDRVGQFAFSGSRLAGYLWASADAGKQLVFHVQLLQAGRSVGSVSYPVYVQPVYVK